MNNFREGLNALREISDPEKVKMALERITGKKIADYEGIDALVASLMGYYNDEVKKKLNKGAYTGNAQDLKNEIDGKVSKTGDTIKGILKIDNNTNNNLHLLRNGVVKGEFDAHEDGVILYNSTSKKLIRLEDNGNAIIYAENLKTEAKEVISGINEVVDNEWRIKEKMLPPNTDLNNITALGRYCTDGYAQVQTMKNIPFREPFTLIVVDGVAGRGTQYCTQIAITYGTDRVAIRNWNNEGSRNKWSAWNYNLSRNDYKRSADKLLQTKWGSVGTSWKTFNLSGNLQNYSFITLTITDIDSGDLFNGDTTGVTIPVGMLLNNQLSIAQTDQYYDAVCGIKKGANDNQIQIKVVGRGGAATQDPNNLATIWGI